MFRIAKEKCIGCGACVSTCNEVYDFANDGLVEVKAQPTEENMASALEAMSNCPTEAIEKVEENKTTTN